MLFGFDAILDGFVDTQHVEIAVIKALVDASPDAASVAYPCGSSNLSPFIVIMNRLFPSVC
jgi:hypothetical protein